MPVWIKGNRASGKFIIFLHGGPGNSGVAEGTVGFSSAIEEEAAVVYWDQRGAGLSDGNPLTITNELIAEDLDLLVDVLQQKFSAEEIILMGHSYGGTISCCYLSKPHRAAKIDGWIIINGTDNLKDNWNYSINWVKSEISKANDSSHWQNALNWYSSLSNKNQFQSHDEVKRHLNYVDSLSGMFHSDDDRVSGSGEQIFFSPIGLGMVSNEKECGYKIDSWWESDYSSAIPAITTPLLLMYGAYDGVFPEESGDSLFNNIGTDSSQKRRILFQNTAHHPHYEETTLFNQEVIAFLTAL